MKKKHRDIVVNGVTYGYVIKGDGRERLVTIYRDKKPVYGVTWRISNITPKDIEEVILKYKL